MYGANASGKTTLLTAIEFMKNRSITSFGTKMNGSALDKNHFLLSTTTENEISSFEIIFLINEEIYRYGFETTSEKIMAEWLFVRSDSKEIELFSRKEQVFKIHKTKFKVQDLINNERISPESLLISVAYFNNNPVARTFLQWLGKFDYISGLREDLYMYFTRDMLQEEKNNEKILQLMTDADLSINELSPINKNQHNYFTDVSSFHKKYDQNNEVVGTVRLSMNKEESSGTQKYFALLGPILATLENGRTLFVDEMDAKIHPNLMLKIVEMFNSKEKNPKNAQLVFNTHNTNLLDKNTLFRKDQVWFTEKDRYGAATLFSLADFKITKTEKEASFEENYIRGKYGAVPFLGDSYGRNNEMNNKINKNSKKSLLNDEK